MRLFTIAVPASVILLYVFLACGEGTANEGGAKNNVPEKELAAVILADFNTMYVRPMYARAVLDSLGVRRLGAGKFQYASPLLEQPLAFDTVHRASLQLYALDFGRFADAMVLGKRLKIWFNAECNDLHPGFLSECVESFGEHRDFGPYMQWEVNNWQSCAVGSGFCVERLAPVGVIRYFPNDRCGLDTFVMAHRDILRFSCD